MSALIYLFMLALLAVGWSMTFTAILTPGASRRWGGPDL